MRRDVVLVGVLFALAFWQNLTQLDVTRFNRDESRWLSRAYYVRDLLDPASPTWDDGYRTRGQPPVGSYVVGLGLLAHGRDLETNGPWVFTCQEGVCRRNDNDIPRNVAAGNRPTPQDLDAGRRTSAFVGALTAVVLYALGRRLTNRVGGVAAALFLAVHPFQTYVSSLATSDALLGLFVAAAAVAAARLADRPTWPRSLLCGVLLGLGGATKLSPLLVAFPLAGLGAALLALAWWRRRTGRAAPALTPDDRLAAMLLALPVVAVATFVAVYPYLWPDPVGRTANLFRFRAEEMRLQGTDYPSLAVPTRADALRLVGETLGDRFSATDRLAAGIAGRLGRTWPRQGADLLLAIVGAELFVALAIRHGLRSRYALAGILLGAQVAVTVLGLRSAFDRYHVPMLVGAAACIGLLFGLTWDWARAHAPAVAPVAARRTEVRRRRSAINEPLAHS